MADLEVSYGILHALDERRDRVADKRGDSDGLRKK